MITVTGSLQDLAGGAVNNGSLLVQLCGIGGALPRVAGTAMLAQSGPQEIDCPAGAFSFALWGNDVITPAGTFYTVQILDANGNVVQISAYQFTGAGTFDLSTVAPYNPPPLALVPLNPVVQNPTGTQTINGNIVINGTLNVSGGVINGGIVTLVFSATPAFDCSTGAVFEMTLTANVTSSTALNVSAVAGKQVTFIIVQDATGGRTFTWPANVKNADTPDTTPNAISLQTFVARANGSLYPLGPMTIN